jgi:hypothetical protein
MELQVSIVACATTSQLKLMGSHMCDYRLRLPRF